MVRTKNIHIRMTEDEMAALKKSAASMGMDVSSYLRRLSQDSIHPMVYDPQIHGQIRGMHEILRALASRKQEPWMSDAVQTQLLEIHRSLRQLSEQMRKAEGGVFTNGNNETAEN